MGDLLRMLKRTSHHFHTLLFDGKLHLAPLDKDKVQVCLKTIGVILLQRIDRLRPCLILEPGQVSSRGAKQNGSNAMFTRPTPGIWAMWVSLMSRMGSKLICGSDFGDQYPNATVIGTDLSPIQPTWVPPNVQL